MSRKRGIFAIEGEWEKDLRDPGSVRPLLDLLRDAGGHPLIYRRSMTIGDFRAYIDKWSRKEYASYSVAYFAFHGGAGHLNVGRTKLTLSGLAKLLGRRAQGRILYFGSCCTLNIPSQQLDSFVAKTGVKALLGYTKAPHWIESSALDLIVLEQLLFHSGLATATKWLDDHCSDLMQVYGFRIHRPPAA